MNIQYTPLINTEKPCNNTQFNSSRVSFGAQQRDTVELSTKKPNKISSFFSFFKNSKPKTNREIFNDRMKELGFSEESIQKFNIVPSFMEKILLSKECIEKLTKDVPEIESEELRAQFILDRSKVTYTNYDETRGEYTCNEKAYNTFNDIFASNKSVQNEDYLNALTNAVITCRDSNVCLDFMKNNIKGENTELYLVAINKSSPLGLAKRLQNLKVFADTNCDKDYLNCTFEDMMFPFDENFDKTVSRMKRFQEEGVTSPFLVPALNQDLKDEEVKRLCDFVDEAAQNRNHFQEDEPVTDFELIDTFLHKNSKNTLRTIDVMGKDNLIKSFPEGLDRIENYTANVGYIEYDMKELQPLIQIINPTGSDKYKELDKQVNDLKQQLHGVSDETERQELIQQINKTSKEKNSMVYNAIKDPVDRGNAAMIFMGLIDEKKNGAEKYKFAREIIPFLNPKTDEEKLARSNKLNELIWKGCEINCPENIRDKFDFSKSKYLHKMFCLNEDFSDNLESLVKVIKKYHRKNVANALDMLPQNVQLKEIFDEYGWDYKKWTRFDPNLKLEISVDFDSEKMQQNAVRNLEAEFNNELFTSLPDEQKDKMFDALANGGYEVCKSSEAEYDEVGFLIGEKSVNRFNKDGKPIEFKDLSKIYNLLEKEFSNNEYWNVDMSDEDVENSKGTFKDHIKTRHDEVKRIRQVKGKETSHIQIQKADMNDIPHALFLGNDASCCTAVGSFNDWSAPNYIKNKMVQAIELKDGDNYIGNTMIYLAAIDERPAIFLDNIELKPKYQYNDIIEKGIIDFAKMIGEQIGIEDIDIYAGPNRHKLNMKNFELENKQFQLVGSTGDDKVYLDAFSDGVSLHHSNFEGTLYKLED